MIVGYFKLLLLFILLVVEIINCEDANFITTTNNYEFSVASNWDIAKVPTIGDRAFINSVDPIKKNLIVESYTNDISVDVFFLGSTSDINTNTTFVTYKNFESGLIWINNGTRFLSGGNLVNSSAIVNNGIIICSQIELHTKELYTFEDALIGIEYSTAYTELVELNNNALLFLNETTFYSINKNPSTPLSIKSTSSLQLLNSDFGATSDFLIRDSSEILLFNSNLLIQNYKSDNIENENLFILYNSGISLVYSTFYSEKLTVITGNSTIGLSNSNFTSLNALLFDDDSLLLVQDNSYLTFYQPVFLDKTSTMLTKSGSTILLYNSIKLLKSARMAFQDSNIIITNSEDMVYDNYTSLFLFDNAKLAVNSSVISLEYASVVIAGYCEFLINNSNAFIKNHVVMSDTSQIYFHYTDSVISGSVTLSNSSKFTGEYSNITIQGSLLFNDQSFFYFNYSNIAIEGSFIDYAEYKNTGGLISSNITVNGYYLNRGIFVLVKSILICNNELINFGGSLFSNTSVTINNGNFKSYGYVQIDGSNILINDGSMIFYMKSYMVCTNSLITIVGGSIIIEPFSFINLTNTIVYNQHGSLDARGDIFIDLGSGLINGGTLILNSNILLKENSTHNDNEKVVNQGIFQIKSNNTNSTQEESNINLPFFNSGSIDISKVTNMKSLVQETGGNLNLLTSNSTLTIQDTFNTTINGSITITVDNLNSSFISIKNQFINNNSSLIIRVDINRINEKNNTIIEWSNSTGIGFSQIQFKSYDPSTNQETDINDSCHSVYKSTNSLSVLITNNCKKSSTLTKAQIVGIVVGIVGFVAIIGCIIYFKKPLYYKFIYNIKEQVNIKLATK